MSKSNGIKWRWRNERTYLTALLHLAGEHGQLVHTLPSPPFQPIAIYFSDEVVQRIALSPEPLGLSLTSAVRSLPTCLERFLGEFAGADYDRSLLLDRIELPVVAQQGTRVLIPTIMGWWRGHVSVLAPSELELDEDFFADRVLFATELNHSCKLE